MDIRNDKSQILDAIPAKVVERAKELDLVDTSNWNELEEAHLGVGKAIKTLDTSLNKVLRKQEYEYLQAYNIYVKRKEKELMQLVGALNEKNSNNNIKDVRIGHLEMTID